MRFGLVHRVLLDSLVALGMLSLVTTGEFPQVLSVALLISLALAFFVPVRWQDLPAWRMLGTYTPVGLLALQLVRWSQGANPLSLAVEFAALLQIVRVATRRGAVHDQQIVALSLLHLVAATVLGAGLAYALCFIGFVLVIPPALMLSHLRREVEGNYRQGARDRTGLPVDVPRILRSRRVVSRGFLAFVCCLSLPVFLFTAVLFVAFPRVGLSLLLLEPTRPTRMVGFSDQVDLGRIGGLHTDPTIAMRVIYPDLPADPPPRIALYLRGTAFDRYENQSWKRTKTERHHVETFGNLFALTRYPNTHSDPSVLIDLEPIEPPVLFVPDHATALELIPIAAQIVGPQPMLNFGPENEIRYARLDDRRGARYRVYLEQSAATAPRAPDLAPLDRARYLELPAELSPQIAALAREWAAPESQPERIAQRLTKRLRSDYGYDLSGTSGGAKNPLEHFLFESKRGHCEFFSTALALMLRSLDIPTRNVTGFAGATYNRFGKFYAVRQGDAHAWVEVWFDSTGWQRFDPTPSAATPTPTAWNRWVTSVRDVVEAASQRWNRHVERYDLKQQIELFTGIRQRAKSLRDTVNWAGQFRMWWWLVAIPVALLTLRLIRRRHRHHSPVVLLPDPRVEEIVRLYRVLERQLEQMGIGRPAATPPLTHALGVCELGHPAGPELLDLTRQYLEVRFGDAGFDDGQAAEFAKRVSALRTRAETHRPVPRAVA